jgi:hypothetical protein
MKAPKWVNEIWGICVIRFRNLHEVGANVAKREKS